MENQNTVPGYEDFIECYDKLEKLRSSKTIDTHRLIYYVTYCCRYIQTLDAYEYQMLIQAMPEMEDKIDTVRALYSKLKSAIFETLCEISKKSDEKPIPIQSSDTSKKSV